MLYPRLLGREFDRLPRVLREFHSAPGGNRASGRAAVRRASFLSGVFGFPAEGDNIALELEVISVDGRETWIRNFGGKAMRTVQWQDGELLLEAMGPVHVAFRIFADETGMQFCSERARLWFIPIPLHVNARVSGGESSWKFEVNVEYLGSYSGAMAPSL